MRAAHSAWDTSCYNRKMIAIKNLTKTYNEITVLNEANFSIDSGKIIALLGPNGAGKTTLINCLLGLTPATSGEIQLFETERPGSLKARKRIGVIPQENSFYPNLTVKENTYFIAKLYGLSNEEFSKRYHELTKTLHFQDFSERITENLSGGMKKRLMLLMALIHNPDFIILDEPTAGVDPKLRIEFWNYFQTIKNQNKSILITTHHISEASDADEVIFLRQGKIIAHDSPEEIIKKYQVENLEQAFLLASENKVSQ